MNRATLDARIRKLCAARGYKFRPWEHPPADVDDGPSPWPPPAAGYASWGPAQELRRRLIRELETRR